VAAATHTALPSWSQGLISELDAADRRAERLEKALTPEQLHWRPRPDAWSLAQCLQHLCVANEGVAAAHLMFGEPVFFASRHARSGRAQLFGEFIATFGLLFIIWGCARLRSSAVPFAVGSYITAAYWFTAPTSFANPAVTLARALRTHSQASGRLMFPDASSPSSRAQSAATLPSSLAGSVSTQGRAEGSRRALRTRKHTCRIRRKS
jgi:hypothetical protein